MRLHVTKGDIVLAKHTDGGCPVARCIARHVPPDVEVSVGITAVFLWDTKKNKPHARLELPPTAREFIAAFDKHREVAPFSFSLELPDAS